MITTGSHTHMKLLIGSLFAAFFFFTLFGISVSYAQSQGGYCMPNLAVYPNGQDPCCPNHLWTCPSAGGVSSVTGTVVGGGGIAGTLAQCSPGSVKDFRSLIMNLFVGCLLSPSVYLIIAFSVVIFLWGVFKFVRSEGEDRSEGKQFMLWGIVGLFVIVSLWALVSILQNTVTLNTNSIIIPR